jgi:hypothetical protein
MSLLIRLWVPAAIQDHFGAYPILASEWNVHGPYSHRYFICRLTSSNDEPHAIVTKSPLSIYITSFHVSRLAVYVTLVTCNVTFPHRPLFVIIGLQIILSRQCKFMFIICVVFLMPMKLRPVLRLRSPRSLSSRFLSPLMPPSMQEWRPVTWWSMNNQLEMKWMEVARA